MSSKKHKNDTSRLYFIALLPSEKIQQEIKEFKDEIKANYGVKHALKLPAHISLQIPFRIEEKLETGFIDKLKLFTENRSGFRIELDGFGRFSQKVIFVAIKNPDPVLELHSVFQKSVMSKIELKDHELTSKIHPHITLATRDIPRNIFSKIWNGFKDKSYQRKFMADIIVLFKHDGKIWHQHKFFQLGFKPL